MTRSCKECGRASVKSRKTEGISLGCETCRVFAEKDIARLRAYEARPEVRAKRRAYGERPEVKQRSQERSAIRNSKPEIKAKAKIRNQDPEVKKKKNEQKRARRHLNYEKDKLRVKDWKLQSFYGITLEEMTEMHSSQEGKCAICQTHVKLLDKNCHLDHDHATGHVRGILCGTCNIGLGLLKDSKDVLKSAIEYLVRSDSEQTSHFRGKRAQAA